jgi:transcriptional regulator with XRE-family HTH domain
MTAREGETVRSAAHVGQLTTSPRRTNDRADRLLHGSRPLQPDALGAVLRRLRLDGDLTLEGLSELSGISDRALSDIERGVARGPQHGTVLAIARALRLSDADRAVLVEAARAGRRHRPPFPLPTMPADNAAFTGRERDLSTITTALTTDPSRPIVITGPPGHGKTSLAVRAAHLVKGAFPDQLFIDLGGTRRDPTSPDAIVRRLGRWLQGRLKARGRPLLVVLDDAAGESQIRALLPMTTSATFLITSRRSLAGLDQVERLRVDRLSITEARQMLAAIIPAEQAVERDLVRLAELCDRVPLALGIAGNRLASQPGWTAAGLVQRLTDRDRRLAALTAGDLQMGTAIRDSVDQLTPRAQELFRRLSQTCDTIFTSGRAAALVGESVPRTEDMLDELADLNLVNHVADHGYELRGLLRLYGQMEATAGGGRQSGDAARASGDQWRPTTRLSRRRPVADHEGLFAGPPTCRGPALLPGAVHGLRSMRENGTLDTPSQTGLLIDQVG